jgi:hypothetical protein
VPVWTGAENLAPSGIGSPDYSASNHTLYGLRYPAHLILVNPDKFRIAVYPKTFVIQINSTASPGTEKLIVTFLHFYHPKILQIFKFILHLSSRDSMPQIYPLSALLNLT